MPGWDPIALAASGFRGPRYCVPLSDREFVHVLVYHSRQRIIVVLTSGEIIYARLELLDEENLYLRDLRVLDVDGSVEYQDGDAVAREDVKSIAIGAAELSALPCDDVPPSQVRAGCGGRPSHDVLALQRSVRV